MAWVREVDISSSGQHDRASKGLYVACKAFSGKEFKRIARAAGAESAVEPLQMQRWQVDLSGHAAAGPLLV